MSGHNGDGHFDRPQDRIVLLVVVIIAAAIAAALAFVPKINGLFTSDKSYEITTQFFFVVVLGGAVGLAYKRWDTARSDDKKRLEEEREMRLVRREALEEFYCYSVSLHHEYKKIRRTLRAKSFQKEGARLIERKTFEHLMDRLEDCQLNAESMKREVLVQKDLFGRSQKDLLDALHKLEGYLRKSLSQHETEYASRREMKDSDLIRIGKVLEDFIASRGSSSNADLFDSAKGVRALVLELIDQISHDGYSNR